MPGYFLLLDRNDLSHPVRGVDDELVGLESLALGRLLGNHSRHCSMLSLLAAERLGGHGGAASRAGAGSLGASPINGRGLLAPPGRAGGLLCLLTCFPCHSFCVREARPKVLGLYLVSARKNKLPMGSVQKLGRL